MAGFMNVVAFGGPELLRGFGRAKAEVEQRIAKRTRLEVEEAMTESRRLVPVDTQRLRSTAFVKGPTRSALGGFEILAGYDTDYAVFVHEVPARHDPPTRDRFLEIPMDARFRSYEATMVRDGEEFISDLDWPEF